MAETGPTARNQAVTAKDPGRAQMLATLALADAIERLRQDVIDELALLRSELALHRRTVPGGPRDTGI